MEKRRIRLEINGVVCGLITQESEEYMNALAQEVGALMKEVLDASPFVTREAAALTAALSYCDDARKNGKRASELQDRIDELEVEAELWQEEKAAMKNAPAPEDPAMQERLRQLEERNTALEEAAGRAGELEALVSRLEDENAALREAALAAPEKTPEKASEEAPEPAPAASPAPAGDQPARKKWKNPMRWEDEYEQEGFVSFFEKK